MYRQAGDNGTAVGSCLEGTRRSHEAAGKFTGPVRCFAYTAEFNAARAIGACSAIVGFEAHRPYDD